LKGKGTAREDRKRSHEDGKGDWKKEMEREAVQRSRGEGKQIVKKKDASGTGQDVLDR